jgi:hypothetical protein
LKGVITVWILAGFAILWLILFGVDLTSRLFFESKVRFDLTEGANTSVLLVHLPGLAGDGVTQIEQISDTLLSHGSLLCVSHVDVDGAGDKRFLRKFMVRAVVDRLAYESLNKGRQRVIFIGTSQGGKQAYRIDRKLAKRGIRADIILVDTPRHAGDLPPIQMLTAPLMLVMPFGVLWNRLSSKAMKVLFIPPKMDQLDPSADRDKLEATVQAAQSTKLSFYRDQVVDIVLLVWLRKGAWADRFVACIWSLQGEDTVRGKRATNGWSKVADGKAHLYEVDAKHAAYGENPQIYRDTFSQIFVDMGV